KWIKKNLLKASIVSNQYLICKEEIEKLLKEKGILKTNLETNTRTSPEINTETSPIGGQINPQINITSDQINLIDNLKKEIEFLREKISTLERTISILEQDKQFLQAQVQQLTNTLSLLTKRQLPEPKGVIDRIKGWFRKE
ncbi:hypothetical protein H5T89_02815, partial [bacterium]|nr:hypothetical protein [bacterium]